MGSRCQNCDGNGAPHEWDQCIEELRERYYLLQEWVAELAAEVAGEELADG